MLELLETTLSWLAAGRTLVWATIVTHEGSTPRSAGSKMIVSHNGVFAGTVGGGLVEAQVLAKAALVLETGVSELVRFDLSGELAAGADMICGGRLRVFLEQLSPAASMQPLTELRDRLARGESSFMLTPLGQGTRRLYTQAVLASPALQDDLTRQIGELARDIQAPVLVESQGESYLLEPWLAPSPLFIAGAGHVSRPTAKLAAMVGFKVTVADDRSEFANAQRFPEADILVVDMDACLKDMDLGPEASVVIVTRGHVHDADVLANALATRAGYIGMIGSRRKREAVYERLRDRGFSDGDFERVHCPIGLSILAETPEEIAVSIVGELIMSRAKRRGA